MDVVDRHGRAMAEFDRRVREIPPDRWDDPTPCEAWSVRDLVDHVVADQRWVPELLAGSTIEEVGDRFEGDQLGEDPVGAWSEASRAAREAITAPGALDGLVHTSGGQIPASVYVSQLTLDLAIHAWDLARAVGADEKLDEELVADLYAEVESMRDEIAGSGLFGEPVPVQPTADQETRLLALLGRAR